MSCATLERGAYGGTKSFGPKAVPLDQHHQIHEILHPAVSGALARPGVRVKLFGPVLFG